MDGTPDPTPELPRSPDLPVEGPTALPALAPDGTPALTPRPAGYGRAAGLAGRALLFLLVIGLGLLHGSRIALGSAPPAEPEPIPDVAAPPAEPQPTPNVAAPPETDWHGVTFYRPPGSTARPPETDLAPRVWIPRPRVGPRMARACTRPLRERPRSAGC